MYKITLYVQGRKTVTRYKSLRAAKRIAAGLYVMFGVVAGIERVKPQRKGVKTK